MKEIIYEKTDWTKCKIVDNQYNRWMLKCLEIIWANEWWEETKDKYFEEIYDWLYDIL